jgi:hypothetical protein
VNTYKHTCLFSPRWLLLVTLLSLKPHVAKGHLPRVCSHVCDAMASAAMGPTVGGPGSILPHARGRWGGQEAFKLSGQSSKQPVDLVPCLQYAVRLTRWSHRQACVRLVWRVIRGLHTGDSNGRSRSRQRPTLFTSCFIGMNGEIRFKTEDKLQVVYLNCYVYVCLC